MNAYVDFVYFFNVTPDFLDNLSHGEFIYLLEMIHKKESEYNIVAKKSYIRDDKTITITPDNADKLVEIAKAYQNPSQVLSNYKHGE